MSPARLLDKSPPAKRRKKNAVGEDNHMDIQALQDAELNRDSLCSPGIAIAIDSIISQRKTSEERRRDMEQVLQDVKSSLESIPTKTKKMSFNSSQTRNTFRVAAKGVHLESVFRSENYTELSIECTPPKRVRVVGGFTLGYSSNAIDVTLEMPSDIFHERDYLNYHYHDKRLLYLTYIARYFIKSEAEKWTSICLMGRCLNGDKLKPTLSLSRGGEPGITVRLIPTYADGLFDKDRLGSDRKNVRQHGESSVVKNMSEATAMYNTSIMIDGTLEVTLKSFHKTLSQVSSLRDTMLLLEAMRIRHRLFDSNFYFAAVLHDIITRGAAPVRASREHLLRCTLTAIRRGILKSLTISGVQIGLSLGESALQRTAIVAGTALRTLESKAMAEDPWYGVVPYLFAAARGTKCGPRPLSTLFDGFIKVSRSEGCIPDSDVVLKVLRRALLETKRVIRLEMIDTGLFGFFITSFHDVCRKVDTRPASWDASLFKSFWGSKSALRRFKDGKIVEALIWSGGLCTLNEIVQYAVRKHLGSDVVSKVILGDLDKAAGMLQADEVSSSAIATFNELASLLRSLEGLPLSILSVHATSPHLRRCGAYAIRPSARSKFVQSLDIVATFESSGAWPDDAVAISAAKAGFYVALKSKLGERGISAQATISFVDIQVGGFVFRLRIRVDKEKELLAGRTGELDELVWVTETVIRHHDNIRDVESAIMGRVARLVKRWLNCHMLLSQMGDRSEELIEVLVASVLSQSTTPVPKSSFRAFCQFLHILAEFPWEVCPVTVALGNEESSGVDKYDDGERRRENELIEMRMSAQNQFAELGCAMSVFCELDDDGNAVSWFSKAHCADAVIVRRIRETAKASLQFIETSLLKNGSEEYGTIFTASTEVFDVAFELDVGQMAFHKPSDSRALRVSGGGVGLDSLLVGFDVTSVLMRELSERFGKYALFMMRMHGGSAIYVVWKPIVYKNVKFSLREAPFRVVEDGAGREMKMCTRQLLAEMRYVGGDLITGVRVKGVS
ncbi:Nucleolar protein 6 [Gracilariopsis chorda]|uniref:Nucleolar protein 6 n=1 Tax=Gracilariopsis chorda TaxID=448386 RepID=A0A2V3IHK7_9FLOR|nr:Nucleolar protein 6 [Gracilariopsis chorda]|eukprot:PXF41595.1 Nucleolar protein 6 [Gracilariopsis chorda]